MHRFRFSFVPWSAAIAFLALISLMPLRAQECRFPASSPVLSTSPDDVPPAAGESLVNYSGVMFAGHPNHQVAFVQTSSNEQLVWFSVDVSLQSGQTLYTAWYNRRYRADSSSPWYWQYSQSQPITLPSNPPGGPVGFVDSVLYSPTAKYSFSNGGPLYKFVMYTINQPTACNGQNGGYVMVSFSNDGYCWTTSVPLNSEGGVSSQCAPELGGNLVTMEAVGAIDAGSTIYLMGMSGDNLTLINDYNMNHNFASWGTSGIHSAGFMTMGTCCTGADKDVSDAGLFNPKAPYDDPRSPDRYRSYAYFFNMAMAWDAPNGDLYVTRGYPYPYDRCNTCNDPKVPTPYQDYTSTLWNSATWSYQYVSGCGGQIALFPNRYQIYRIHLGSLSSFSLVHTGTWTLVADRGNSLGYETTFTYASTPLVTGQSNDGRDSGAASILVDGAGNLVRDGSGAAHVFAGNTSEEQLSIGRPCKVTGNERIVYRAIP